MKSVEEKKKKEVRKWESVHLYMVWSEEKLTVEVGLFYKVWICDAHLQSSKYISRDNKTYCNIVREEEAEQIPTSPKLLANPTPSREKFFSISQPMAPQPT